MKKGVFRDSLPLVDAPLKTIEIHPRRRRGGIALRPEPIRYVQRSYSGKLAIQLWTRRSCAGTITSSG